MPEIKLQCAEPVGRCKPGWFRPKMGKVYHRNSFAGVVLFGDDCSGRYYWGSTYSPARPPDEQCCAKYLALDNAPKKGKARA